MEEVQKCDCLYNKYSKEFKDRNKKDNAWKEVASRFEDLTPSEATKDSKTLDHLKLDFSRKKRRHRLAQVEMLSPSSLKI